MKSILGFVLFLPIIFCCCQQPTKTLSHTKDDNPKSMLIDTAFRGTVERNIQFTSSRYFSSFKTPLEVRFFSNGILEDSINEKDFNMMSWYSIRHDTIDLVAHMGILETKALLLRFVNGKPTVLFFRAPHDVEVSKNFKIQKQDSFVHQIEVAPIRYNLKLSEIPDTANKQVVFGYIDMTSGSYYDRRDSTEQPLAVQMKFYFRSQYRKFDY